MSIFLDAEINGVRHISTLILAENFMHCMFVSFNQKENKYKEQQEEKDENVERRSTQTHAYTESHEY